MSIAHPTPWALVGQAIRDANDGVVVSAINPCGMETRKMIVAAVNAASERKPRRNCDRFGGDFKMLHTAWFDWTGSPSGLNPDGTVKLTFAEWLLAPAKEKGGAVGTPRPTDND